MKIKYVFYLILASSLILFSCNKDDDDIDDPVKDDLILESETNLIIDQFDDEGSQILFRAYNNGKTPIQSIEVHIKTEEDTTWNLYWDLRFADQYYQLQLANNTLRDYPSPSIEHYPPFSEADSFKVTAVLKDSIEIEQHIKNFKY